MRLNKSAWCESCINAADKSNYRDVMHSLSLRQQLIAIEVVFFKLVGGIAHHLVYTLRYAFLIAPKDSCEH